MALFADVEVGGAAVAGTALGEVVYALGVVACVLEPVAMVPIVIVVVVWAVVVVLAVTVALVAVVVGSVAGELGADVVVGSARVAGVDIRVLVPEDGLDLLHIARSPGKPFIKP